MRIDLSSQTTTYITSAVTAYATASGETFNSAMIPFIIKMLVQKYVSVRFPASVTEETATEDAEAYFESHAEEIALKIPMIIGRFGTEGELSHSENGVSMTYKFGDPLYDVFPNVVPLAEVL